MGEPGRRVSRRRGCKHRQMITVRTYGLERRICEDCGYLSFEFDEDLSGDAERGQFAREADRYHRESTVG